jgi:murein DD-endopeptidase MepM/ murein hydrolase activator NlpD
LVFTRVRLALVSVPLILAVAAPAFADDLKSREANNRKKQQDVATKLNLAKASDAQVEAEKARLAKAVAAQTARVDDAGQSLASAQAALAETAARIDRLQAETNRLRGAFEGRAIYAYLHPGPSLFEGIAHSKSIAEAGRRMALLDHVQASSQALLDQYHAARVDLAHARAEREKAQADAAKRAQAETDARNRLATAEQNQQKTHEELQKRIQGLQGEMTALASEDAKIRALLAGSGPSTAAKLSGRGNETPNGSSFANPTKGGFIWPVHGPVTSEYGDRWGGFHSGIDIGAEIGVPIAASKTGVVVYAGWNDGGYGNLVLIDHGNGYATAYGHQSRVAVSVGQVINQGQTLGYVGCTGNCSGQHLHFEVRVNGSPQNPRNFVGGSP